MTKESTKDSTVERIKIDQKIRDLYEKRDRSLDHADPDIPVLPPDMWDNAIIGKYYRVKKTPVTFRIDNDVLAWLKAKGDGHLTKINGILRKTMLTESKH